MGKHQTTKRLRALLREVETTASERLQPLYNRHGVDEDDGVDALVDEMCLDGANTIASLFRGWQGVGWAEIVRDVAKTLKVESAEDDDHVTVERKILDHLFRQHYESASEDEQRALDDALREAVTNALASSGPTVIEAVVDSDHYMETVFD